MTTNINDLCVNGGDTHAWENTGLDTIDADRLRPRPAGQSGDILCTTRRCAWCKAEQAKSYGNGGRKPWRQVQQ